MVDESFFLTPRIMTDAILAVYAPNAINGSSPAQRLGAYVIAEQLGSEEIGTFLKPVTVSGTYPIPFPGRRVQLRKKRVHSVSSVALIHMCVHTCVLDECDQCAFIMNDIAGIIDVRWKWSPCSCGCACTGYPMGLRVMYTAGLASGLATHPNLLNALSIVSELALEQIVDPSRALGGPGDPGILSWRNLGYFQQNVSPICTRFGRSPRANYAANLMRAFKNGPRALQLG